MKNKLFQYSSVDGRGRRFETLLKKKQKKKLCRLTKQREENVAMLRNRILK